jgi:hypothetical protein
VKLLVMSSTPHTEALSVVERPGKREEIGRQGFVRFPSEGKARMDSRNEWKDPRHVVKSLLFSKWNVLGGGGGGIVNSLHNNIIAIVGSE